MTDFDVIKNLRYEIHSVSEGFRNEERASASVIEKLRGHIFASDEGRDLAKQVIQLFDRDYHCTIVSFEIRVTQVALGEIASCLGIATRPPRTGAPWYDLKVQEGPITVTLQGPPLTAQFTSQSSICNGKHHS